MEVVLAVITLATAVKDMVELAEKIHASLEKVSDNLRNARVLASEIKKTITELKEFCEQHGATLENDKDLRGALLEVISKLRLFNSESVPLISSLSPNPRLLNRVKGGFKAWRNNGRIEASIRELKEEVKKCQMNFMMMSVARMQVKLNEMHRSTSEGFRVIQQGVSDILVAHNTGSFALQPSSFPSQTLISASHQNIVAFAQTSSSTSIPIWKTPSVMDGQIIRDAYLKVQIDCIDNSLSEISTLGTIYSIEPLGEYANPFYLTHSQWLEYSSPESLHRGIVIHALQMCEALKKKQPINTSIQKGASDLTALATGLRNLGMYEEALKMGKWAVSLFRTLVRADEATYSPYLVLTLKSLSGYNADTGNNDGVLDTIAEAFRISEALQTPTAPVQISMQHAMVLSAYARRISRIKRDHKRAIKLAEQSVKLMEDVHDIGSLSPSYKRVDGVVQVSRSFLTQLYKVLPSALAIEDYAWALRDLSNCLMADGRRQEALDAKLRALPVFYDMPSLLGKNTDLQLAGILYELVSQKCKSLLPAEQVLKYADDCVGIRRKYAELNPLMYGRLLCDALWQKADILSTLNRDSDALEVWKEIAKIAQQMLQDQAYCADALSQVSWSFRRLKRREEAVSVRTQSVLMYQAVDNRVTGTQARAYLDLCVEYQLAMMFPQAVDAGRKAVEQCRVLAIVQPNEWTWRIGRALSALADSLFSAGDYETALHKGHESMQIFERHINKTDPRCVQAYIKSLRSNAELATTVNNKQKTPACMDDILRRMQQLALKFPKEANCSLLATELDYVFNLYLVDDVQEAQEYVEELIAQWETEEQPHVDKEALTGLHMRALITYANILVSQGDINLALVPIQQAAGIGRPFSATNPKLAGETVRAMYKRAHLLVELGRYDEALVVAEGTLMFSREIKMYDSSHIVGTLHVVGLAAQCTRAYGRVVEVSQEAVNIYRSADFVEYHNMAQRDFCPLSSCLQLLSSGHANSGNLKPALHYAQEAVDDAKAFPAKPRIPHTDLQQYYMEANGHLGAMYLANGKIDAAREAFEETRAYYTERVEVRPGISGSLVSTLHQLGIIYCSEDRHDEGHTAAQEAKKSLDHLAEVLPALYEQVHIAMRHELTTPSLQVLNRMKETLSCNHQAVLSF